MSTPRHRPPLVLSPQSFGRRRFLQTAGAFTALAAFGGARWPRGATAGSFSLFSLGVASGDPGATSVILWTRLAPDPLAGGGMPDEDVKVDWEVFADEALSQRVQRGHVKARPEDGHAVHVQVKGLRPSRHYWYRFRAQGEESRIGRTRTLPTPGSDPDQLRFGVVSCQDWQNGFYPVYGDIAQQELDFVVHVGDYIYEYAAVAGAVRQHDGDETQTLLDYRNRHALYKLDPQLQEVHARFPFLVTWDDHEVQDNYANDHSQYGIAPAEFLTRRVAAYRAYFESMPLRRPSRPRRDGGMTLFRRFDYGRLARILLLDGRQFRSDQPCDPPALGIADECPEIFAEERTMLGARQHRWVEAGLRRSRARWNVLAQQTMMTRGDLSEALGGDLPIYNVDAWDGYQAERQQILDFLATERPSNPIVLTGDIHSAWVTDLKQDFLDPSSPTVAVEFVGTSVTTEFPEFFVEIVEANLGPQSKNPHILFFEGRKHGWLRCTVTPARWQTDFRVVDSILDASAPASTVASWFVDDGVPGGKPL